MAVPDALNAQYRNNIRFNQQNLITAYNIYHSMMHIAVGESYPNRTLGLFADLAFQTNCSAAYIPTDEEDTCNCL